MPPPPNNFSPLPAAPPIRNRVGRLLALLLGLVWVVGATLIILNLQALEDWWRLRGYQAPATISQLADQATMNSYTRHLFYLNKPQLVGTVSSFRQHCPENKDTIVLGCYHPDQNGIYIYNVPDPALAGVQQVTAAHEVLHAVYARLSTSDRNTLNAELEDFYKHDLQDSRVQAEVKLYQQTEPTDVMDEMSCTFGTEIANLPTGLQAYYSRYFTNRAAIVGFEQQYEGEFTSRQTTISSDDQQLTIMKQQIDSQQTALDNQLQQLNSDQSHLNSLTASGQSRTYNAAVPGYNAEVDAYNQGVNSLRSLITSYNQLVASRNQIAGQLTTLDSALDTRLLPKSTR
jgi:uncharacterized protein YukE